MVNSNLEKIENEKILPDGSMDIIFNFGTSTSSISTNSIGISGMMTEFSNKSFNENSDLFGINLAFTTENVEELMEQAIKEGGVLLEEAIVKPWGQKVG